MRFNSAFFDRHLTSIGQRVLWRRSFACPCVSPHSGQPDPKHALCNGKGRIWNDPIETITGVASQGTLAKWAALGMWASGDLVLSVPQSSVLWDAGQFDRISMLNSTDVFSQPLVRNSPTERLLFTPSRFTRCFWLDPVTRTVVEADLPTLGVDNRPQWVAGQTQPLPGVTYSLTGEKFLEYFIFDQFPGDRNQHAGMRLPKRVVARQWDLFGR